MELLTRRLVTLSQSPWGDSRLRLHEDSTVSSNISGHRRIVLGCCNLAATHSLPVTRIRMRAKGGRQTERLAVVSLFQRACSPCNKRPVSRVAPPPMGSREQASWAHRSGGRTIRGQGQSYWTRTCPVRNDASHNHNGNNGGNHAASTPFPTPRVIWVSHYGVSVYHGKPPDLPSLKIH